MGADPGLGVYMKKFTSYTGQIKLLIRFTTADTVVVSSEKCTAQQRKYAVDSGFEERKLIVPSLESLAQNRLDFYFYINHDSTDPTHKLCWNSDESGRDFPYSHPYLIPLRALKAGEELTFKYN